VAVYGNYAAVGAPNYDGSEYQSGAVYVFEYSGGSWSQMDQLLPPMAESNGYFGSSVAMNETNIMVGASGSRNGAVYRREGTDWNLMANIEPGDGEEEEAFGSCVDLSEDYGVAGALSTHARKAYLFYPVDYNFILWNQKDFVYLRNGWKWFDWFGYVNDEIYPWVKHFEHGWMYSVSSSSDSIWFYTWDMGWLWTSTTLYPYIYRSSDDAWLWYQRDTVNPRWFANLRTSLWETH